MHRLSEPDKGNCNEFVRWERVERKTRRKIQGGGDRKGRGKKKSYSSSVDFRAIKTIPIFTSFPMCIA